MMNKKTYIQPFCNIVVLYPEGLCQLGVGSGVGEGDGWMSNKKERNEEQGKKTIWNSSSDENNSTWLK